MVPEELLQKPHEVVVDSTPIAADLASDVETSSELSPSSRSLLRRGSMNESDPGTVPYKRPADLLEHSKNKQNRGTVKQKSTRGVRACTNCHRLKMKCEGAENGGPCLRCARSGHECIFLQSNRGRKGEKRRKLAAMQQNKKTAEQTFMSVLQGIQKEIPTTHASAASASAALKESGAISPGTLDALVGQIRKYASGRDPSAQSVREFAEASALSMQQLGLLDSSAPMKIEPGDSSLFKHILQVALVEGTPIPSAKTPLAEAANAAPMPLLPDNTLNPLGLFAEASLQNLQMQRSDGAPNQQRSTRSPTSDSGEANGEAAENNDPPAYGVANETYFHSSTACTTSGVVENEKDEPPELLTENIVSSEEVLELFRIFFHHCSLHLFLLDPEWHTPTLVCSRSLFLFTCVCAVASKFLTRRPDLYSQCQRRAIKSAFDVMSRGVKSTEIVQGFLLLTLYNQPVERFEQDRTWLFAGVAIRMAQDLNLHRKCVVPEESQRDEDYMREILNRERTWYICFCVDRTLSAQMGKPYSIREDFIIRHASDWCVQTLSRPWDLGICALVDLLRVQTRQLDFLYSSTVTPSGLNVDLDYPAILPSFNEQLNETMQFWYRLGLDATSRAWNTQGDKDGNSAAHEPNGTHPSHPIHGIMANMSDAAGVDKLRVSTLLALHEADPPGDNADLTTRSMYYIARQAPLRYNYAVLVLNSFGLQYALERPADGASVDKPQCAYDAEYTDPDLLRCVHAAKEIISTVKCGMREILRYAPDPTFVAVAYACVFLLKLIRPVFAHYINEDEIIALVNYTIEVLEEAAVNETHTPALYASFLRNLVQTRREQSNATQKAPPQGPGAVDEPNAATPALMSRSPAMTVDPSQVNPMAVELAASDQLLPRTVPPPPPLPSSLSSPLPTATVAATHLAPGAIATAPAQTLIPTVATPASELALHPPMATPQARPTHHQQPGEADMEHPTLSLPLDAPMPMDMPSAQTDTFPDVYGWDAMQYAKAQGVEVNRVLDTSFWTSLLPPGYGSGGPSTTLDAELFRPNLTRAANTPGATRPPSPTLMPHFHA